MHHKKLFIENPRHQYAWSGLHGFNLTRLVKEFVGLVYIIDSHKPTIEDFLDWLSDKYKRGRKQ